MNKSRKYNEIKEWIMDGGFLLIQSDKDLEVLYDLYKELDFPKDDNVFINLTKILSKLNHFFVSYNRENKQCMIFNELAACVPFVNLSYVIKKLEEEDSLKENEKELNDDEFDNHSELKEEEFEDEEIDEKSDYSLIDDLEGLVVEERCGRRFLVLGKELVSLEESYPLDDYIKSEDTMIHKRHRSCDIVKVYEKPEGYGIAKALYGPVEELYLIFDLT